jgi:hypothetical protein
MARDTNLRLYNSTVTATSNGDAIDIDGGQDVVVEVMSTVDPTDADETLDIEFQVSLDGGTDYITICKFPQFEQTDDKGNADTHVAMVGYVPRANANPDPRGENTRVKARLKFTVGGTTPSFTILSYLTHRSGVAYGSTAGFTSGVPGRYGPLDAIKACG